MLSHVCSRNISISGTYAFQNLSLSSEVVVVLQLFLGGICLKGAVFLREGFHPEPPALLGPWELVPISTVWQVRGLVYFPKEVES